jgi:RNA polymerase sigma-70 factor (ECF subfamily)
MGMALTDPEPATLRFDALYRETASELFAYAHALLRDRAAAEDVAALAFERAYRRRDRFDPRRGSQRAWLFTIARNAALDELRRRKRTTALVVDPEDPAARDAGGEDDEAAVRRAAVRAALAALEPRDRELVALKFEAGLSNREIAEVLGVSESNAGTRLHRAVHRLREACHAPS